MITTIDHIVDEFYGKTMIAMTSMPADPLHPGHISCLQSMRSCVDEYQIEHMMVGNFITVCVVNDDDFLINKKGYAFMPLVDRMSIIDSIDNGCDYVAPFTPSNPKDMTVVEAIRKLKPDYFLKGGDRKADSTLPEWDVCQELGCVIIDGVGADKVWSSRNYLNEYAKFVMYNCK